MDAENGLTHVFKQLIYQMPGQVEDVQTYLNDQYIAAHSPNLEVGLLFKTLNL